MSEGKKQSKLPPRRQIIVVIIVAAIVIGVSAISANSGSGSQKDLRNDIENFCTDATLLRKYIPNNISIVDALNYDDNFSDLGEENGKHQYYYSWHGKNKTTDETVHFECAASDTGEDDLALEWLNVDGTTVFERESPTEQ